MTTIEQKITDYITSTIKANSDISIKEIKSDIASFIYQEPAIEIKYEKIRVLNESTKKYEIVSEPIKSVTVAFVDENSYIDNKPTIKRFEIFI